MQMRPQIQIKSIVKALTDVVLPAVDPDNKLAQEQARLAIGLLTLLAEQLPLQYRFDRDELHRLLVCSGELQATARGGRATQAALAALAGVTRSAAEAFGGASTSPDALLQWVRALRAATGTLVTQLYHDGDPACRAAIRDIVLAMSKEQLLRDRSMLLMQGWEPDPKAVPPLQSLLDARPDGASTKNFRTR
jgi:hypothetical protein